MRAGGHEAMKQTQGRGAPGAESTDMQSRRKMMLKAARLRTLGYAFLSAGFCCVLTANAAAQSVVPGLKAFHASFSSSGGDSSSSAPAESVEGSLSGTVVDGDGAAVPQAQVALQPQGSSEVLHVNSQDDGTFEFPRVSAGQYHVRVARDGFAPWEGKASLEPGQPLRMGDIALLISRADSIEVRASGRQIAEAQVQLEEQQRVLGVFPNFYASYVPNAEPLSAGEKFRLAMRFAGDPVAFGMAGVVSGSEQRANTFRGYGRGGSGYSRRFGAAYADGLTSTMLGQAAFPALFHQDPRYFVKGTGSVSSRFMYAVATMVICKGDNRHWQFNYSNVLGNFASAGLSNAYYPASDRGAGLVIQNALTATALGAVGGLFQEFLLHRMTPHLPDYTSAGE